MSTATINRSSEPLKFTVKKAALTLPAPEVPLASGNWLDPYDALDGATARITYVREASDLLYAAWSIVGQGEVWRSPNQSYPGTGPVEITVPPRVIALSLRAQVEVRYGVTRGGTLTLSPALVLTVGDLSQSQLPTPSVLEANQQGELHLGSFVGDARVHIEPWPLIAEGQRYWITGHGVLADGTPYQIPISTAQVITPADVQNGITTPLSRSELEKLQNKSEIKIMASVTFDGSENSGSAVNLPPSVLSLIAKGNKLVLEEFKSLRGGAMWSAGETIELDDMSIKIDEGGLSYYAGGTDYNFHGFLSDYVGNSRITCYLTEPAHTVILLDRIFTANHASLSEVEFYNGANKISKQTASRGELIATSTDTNIITHFTFLKLGAGLLTIVALS